MLLENKNVLLCITGGIAAYKMADTASMLVKEGADVHVCMTKNAEKFITAETFRVLTKNKVYTDVFDEDPDDPVNVPHISLGTSADIILVAPASADIIGKIANGIADDMVSTVVLPATCPVLLSPSMNVYMYENKIVQDNLEKLKRFGYKIIEPASGHLACGYDGKGKLPTPEALVESIIYEISAAKDLVGKKILVNAGPTCEAIDPVRYITNHSSGKMGFALARAASLRGADVTLVTGQVSLDTPFGVERVDIVSAADMYREMTSRAGDNDIIIMSAAVADYTPENTATEKIKKKDGDMTLSLGRTKDILKELGSNKKDGQIIVGFSMETENLLENSRKKLSSKNADMICANSLRTPGAGYQVDTNIITLITPDSQEELPLMSKLEASHKILDKILELGK